MHAGERLIAGGNYVKDFFDVNLPLTLCFYTPPVLISHVFSISIAHAVTVYIFIIATISLGFCYFFLQKIYSKDLSLGNLLFVTLTFLFLIFPQYHLGQREYFFFVLTMPYSLLLVYRLQGYPVNRYLALGVGVFSGIGFFLKPYFLLTLACLEGYHFFCTRRLLDCFRIESIVICLMLIIYCLAIYIFYPNYFSVIVPISQHFFYSGNSLDPWIDILLHPVMFLCLAVIMFYFLQLRGSRDKLFCSVMMVSLISFLLIYFIQHTRWPYRYLPSLSMAVILSVIFLYQIRCLLVKNKMSYLFLCLLTAIVLSFPFYFVKRNYFYAIANQQYMQYIIHFLQTNVSHQSVCFFTTEIEDVFPAVDYSTAQLAAHSPHMPLLPGIVRKSLRYGHGVLPPVIQQAKDFQIKMVVDDLNRRKPDWVLVDDNEYKSFLTGIDFDYIQYFSSDDSFRHAWSAYQYVTTIEKPLMEKYFAYKYKVYKRV